MASLQGAIRKILAEFTVEADHARPFRIRREVHQAEVDEDLKAWGVQTVKSVELMDIRDVKGHNVIGSIMAKRISGIDRESREKVAENQRAAQGSRNPSEPSGGTATARSEATGRACVTPK
jgi:flotillin